MNLMKNLTYNNINSNFSLENVCLQLSKFWLKENLIKNSKIWLTITVFNKQNKSFILINNLPFNTSDYTDFVVVLKQVFETKIFSNRKDKMDRIIFKYYLESKFNWKEYYLNILLFILYWIFLVFTTFILFYATSVIFNILLCVETINNNNLEVISQSTISSDIIKGNTKNINKCVFSVFSDFFDRSNISYVYYPSYFTGNNNSINIIICDSNSVSSLDSISSLDYIISKQFYILNKTVESYTNYFNKNEALKCDLNAIATEYSYYKQYCIANKL